MSSELNAALPMQLYGASSLSFNKDEFMKADFSVDNFVRTHQSASSGGLEALRDDLGVYLKVLRSAMIELINQDYADFVNLSTNFTGLDRVIDTLKTPLGQLREEVLSVQKLLDDAMMTTSADLGRRQSITKEKSLLHRLTQISNRLERMESLLKEEDSDVKLKRDGSTCASLTLRGDLVDRLAAEVNHLNFLVLHCQGTALLDVFKPRVAAVCQVVERGLEFGLREGVINKDLHLLRRTLRTYASLGSLTPAHTLVRELVHSSIFGVINENALSSDPRGLPGMYMNALDAVNSICLPLLAVTDGTGPDCVNGYSFLESSAWPEIVLALETTVQQIFIPGNPARFHKNYIDTIAFLESFERLLGSQAKVEAFRQLTEYQQFLENWNLPVYFQIRYQEIAHTVESNLLDNNGLTHLSDNLTEGKSGFTLISGLAVWKSLLQCCSPEIFLQPLLHRFWKLILLILSRYRTWVTQTMDLLQSGPSFDLVTEIPTSKSKDSEVVSVSDKPVSVLCTNQFVHIFHDVVNLAQMLPTFFVDSLSPLLTHLPEEKKMIVKAEIDQQTEKLVLLSHDLSRIIETNVGASLSPNLKQVIDTPRLYRRTNRPPPITHQPYIMSVTTALLDFANDNQHLVDNAVLSTWLSVICTDVSDRYKSVTYDVLSSVHKMEESLKKLKRARDRGIQGMSDINTGLSDDDKIRLQISLDIEYFGEQLKHLQVDAVKIESFVALHEMVQNAKIGKFTL